ncbi:MAG: DUF1926 domain-containing protein [Candidatus Latescibacteria bacterium]|nr:DUF1926 domain-containing protein [Candidatus Latescibacterota bacterium]
MATLILGIHDHQPVGNFDHVIRDAHERAYRPFLDTLERHPSIKMAVHVSGPLLEWHRGATPDYLDRLGALVERGQVEMVGGGYWEPILTTLPERDRHQQVETMCRELERRFGRRPRGLWLAERIWEPHLPKLLAEHGLDWVALDDSHFLATGFANEALGGYYLTEEEGHRLAVFPVSMRLRYLVPFHPVPEILAHLRTLDALAGRDLAVLMDDGEKFGVWSSTHALCYEEGYLDALFAALADAPEVTLAGFSETLDARGPLGSAYLPTASYTEMGEWALPLGAQRRMHALGELAAAHDADAPPADALSPFVRGGFWRNFFVKYEESHWMHKRMLWTRREIETARAAGHARAEDLDAAEDLLLQAQCNCGYWHGLFGGLYLPHLRHAIFQRLLAAEARVVPREHAIARHDLDFDGQEEIVWTSPRSRLFAKPRGGLVRELDSLAAAFPFSNCLSRREEGYHAQLRALASAPAAVAAGGAQSIHDIVRVKEEGLEAYLVYDPHPRAGLEEGLYAADAETLAYGSAWLDFAALDFAVTTPESPDGALLFAVEHEFEPGRRLRLEKRLRWLEEGAALDVQLRLSYRGASPLRAKLGSGWNFNLLAPDAPDRRVLVDGAPAADPRLASRGWEQGGRLELRDDWSGVRIALAAGSLAVYREPIETVSLSEEGFERVYQGSWICACRDLDLDDGQSAEFAYRVELGPLDADGGATSVP